MAPLKSNSNSEMGAFRAGQLKKGWVKVWGFLTEVEDFHRRGGPRRGRQSQSTEIGMPLTCVSREHNLQKKRVYFIFKKFEPLSITSHELQGTYYGPSTMLEPAGDLRWVHQDQDRPNKDKGPEQSDMSAFGSPRLTLRQGSECK